MSNIVLFDTVRESIEKREALLRRKAAMFRLYTSDRLWEDIKRSIQNRPESSKKSSDILQHWVEHWFSGFTAILDEIFNIGYGLLLREYQFGPLTTGLKVEPPSYDLGKTVTGYTAYDGKETQEICVDSYAGLLSALNPQYKEKFRFVDASSLNGRKAIPQSTKDELWNQREALVNTYLIDEIIFGKKDSSLAKIFSQVIEDNFNKKRKNVNIIWQSKGDNAMLKHESRYTLTVEVFLKAPKPPLRFTFVALILNKLPTYTLIMW